MQEDIISSEHKEFAGADIFPQGFSATADRLREFKGINMLCDVDNGTMNVMYINGRRPQKKKCFTEKYGAHQYMLAVHENLVKLYDAAGRVTINDDICVTAKGYGYLVAMIAKKNGGSV